MNLDKDYNAKIVNSVERNRVFVGDVYLDDSKERDFDSSKNAKKFKENVLLINIGDFYVEFSNIKNKKHLTELQLLIEKHSEITDDGFFLSYKPNKKNPYFVKDIKRCFNFHTSQTINFEELNALSYYLLPDADCSF